MKVFLGGTCNNSTWREELIPMLKIDYFNPVVKDWTPECQAEEIKQREACDFVLYTITPLMMGVYSIAEVVDDSNKRPEKTIFCLLEYDKTTNFYDNGISCPAYSETITEFSKPQLKSLYSVSNMVVKNGARSFNNLKDMADYLNHKASKI